MQAKQTCVLMYSGDVLYTLYNQLQARLGYQFQLPLGRGLYFLLEWLLKFLWLSITRRRLENTAWTLYCSNICYQEVALTKQTEKHTDGDSYKL